MHSILRQAAGYIGDSESGLLSFQQTRTCSWVKLPIVHYVFDNWDALGALPNYPIDNAGH